jgi:DNA-binding MarR family transcriptional regulator
MGRPAPSPSPHVDARRLLELLRGLAASAFRPILWKRALELELTYAQAQVLFYVQRHPGCPLTAVARAYGVTLPAISQVVDRLGEKRFLVRPEDPRDRRAARLRLTPEGDGLARELEQAQVDGLAGLLGRLSAEERRKLLAGLDALVSAAGAAG